jgi:hypothetical protein
VKVADLDKDIKPLKKFEASGEMQDVPDGQLACAVAKLRGVSGHTVTGPYVAPAPAP